MKLPAFLKINQTKLFSLKINFERSKVEKQQPKEDINTYPTSTQKSPINLIFIRFPIKEQAHFAKRLAFLIGAGVPIVECLHILHDQSTSNSHKYIYSRVIDDVSSGKFLSASLGKFERFFGIFVINIIKIGETGGTLTQNLNYLADELKKKEELRKKVISALLYPIFITLVTLLLSGTLTVFIFPKVMPIFQTLDVDLPFSTIILLAVSDFLGVYGLHVIVGSILIFIVLRFAMRSVHVFRYFMHRVSLKLPLFGKLMKYYHITNFSRTLGLLLQSGVNIVEALTITGNTMSNLVYKEECIQVAEVVLKGERISTYIVERPFHFPDFTAHLIAVGEMTGSLSDTLLYLSDMYESEVTDMTKNLSNSIEPLLMIFMGLIVGFVAVSVIMPIYEVTQYLQP